MDFDRDAIGSLEDLHREWDGLENERAKVEDRLRSFDAGGRGGLGRRGGRGGGGGRGNGGGRGIGHVGRAPAAGGDWSKDSNATPEQHPRKHQQTYVSREKYRAMAGKWERGLDPDKAAAEAEQEEKQAADDSTSRPLERSRGADGSSGVTAGRERRSAEDRNGVIRGDRERFRTTSTRNDPRNDPRNDLRNEIRNNRRADLRNNIRNGTVAGAQGREVRGRREFDSHRGFGNGNGNGGDGIEGGEPVPKRPRVTSTIVVPAEEEQSTAIREGEELDRWDAGPAPTADEEERERQEHDQREQESATDKWRQEEEEGYDREKEDNIPGESDEAGQDGDGAGAADGEDDPPSPAAPRFTSKIVVAPGARGRAARDFAPAPLPRPRGERNFLERIGGGGRRGGVGGGIRPSLASRLGPVVGPGPRVEGGEEGDAAVDGGEGAVPEAPPVPEPTKPEVHAAYKDGDTKKRNRRMFGGLMAHLGRARQQLDQDKSLIERQNSMAKMAAVRQAQEKRRQRQMEIEAARKERDDELHKRDYIAARQQKALIALHGNAYMTNQEQLKGAIFTKALPQLAWSPNEHTDVTQALLVESNREIDARIAQRKEVDDLAFQKIDDSVAQRAAARSSRRQEGRLVIAARDGSIHSGEGSDRWRAKSGQDEGGEKLNQEEEHHPESGDEGEGYQRKRSYLDSFEEQHNSQQPQEQQQHDDHEVVHNDSGAHGNGIDYGEASALSVDDDTGKGEEEGMHGESSRDKKDLEEEGEGYGVKDGMDDDHVEGRVREVMEEHLSEERYDGGLEREGERSNSVDGAAAGEAFTMKGKGDGMDLDSGGAVGSETRDYDPVTVQENEKGYNRKEGREGRSDKKSRKERKRKEKRGRREKVDGDDYDAGN